MARINSIAYFDDPGLDIGGGKLAQRFAGDQKVGAAIFGTPCGKKLPLANFPGSVTLNQHETFVGWDGGDAADKFGRMGCRIFVLGFVLLAGEQTAP